MSDFIKLGKKKTDMPFCRIKIPNKNDFRAYKLLVIDNKMMLVVDSNEN